MLCSLKKMTMIAICQLITKDLNLERVANEVASVEEEEQPAEEVDFAITVVVVGFS